ncbi:MAG: TolC family protein [Bacteroidales bacterium]
MKYVIIFIFCLLQGELMAQDSLNLASCHKKSIDNYPMIRQRDLLQKITAEKINGLKTAYLPQLSLNGQASYQSDVTEVPINVPFITIPEVDKDVYKVSLDLNQVIWDGGTIRKQKDLEQISLKTEQQSLEAELYKIKDRVNQIYFSILSLQLNRKILSVMLDDLNQKYLRLESGVKNGIILESQLDVLQAEKLKILQNLAELDISYQAGLAMLGEFTNEEYPVNQALVIPQIEGIIAGPEHKRLETRVMELQMQKLDVSKELAGTRYKPKLYGIAQAGYGKPGFNMLKSEFDTYWMLGARLSWNIWNWHQLRKELKVMDFQKEVISSQQQTFDKNLAINLENQIAQVNKYQFLLTKDDEIILLRTKITKTAASQLENGVITSSDYITELNQEIQARLNRENHSIQLIKAKADYLTLKGIY